MYDNCHFSRDNMSHSSKHLLNRAKYNSTMSIFTLNGLKEIQTQENM